MISSSLLILILVNTIFFFTLVFKNIVQISNSKYASINKAEVCILGIAFTQYALTFIIENSNVLDSDSSLFAQQLRYVDWLITTPLLLYSYWKLANIEGYKGDLILIIFMDILMILCGILAEILITKGGNKLSYILLFIVGTLAFVVIVFRIIDIMKFFSKKDLYKEQKLGYFFLIGWLIYPIGFFLPDEFKYTLYSIGDFINKGLYSLNLSQIIN